MTCWPWRWEPRRATSLRPICPNLPPLAALTRWSQGAAKEARTADHPSMLDSCWKRLSPRRETPYTPDNQRIPDHEHSVQCPPSQRHAAGHQGKGRFVCCVHSLFVEGGILSPPSATTSWATTSKAADLARRYPALPGGGRVAWVTPARAAGKSHPGGGHPVSKDENPVCSSSRSKKSWELPWARASYPDHLMAPLPCADPLAGRLFILMPHVC